MKTSSTISTRARLRAVPAALAGLLLPAGVVGAQEEEPTGGLSEVPTFGASRPGPVRPSTPTASPEDDAPGVGAAAEDEEDEEVPAGVAPARLVIENAAVDAEIERGKIEDGVMLDPSTPYIVTWYDELGYVGQGTNVVMSGHLDYFDVPIGVFYYVPQLVAGDLVQVTDEDGAVWEYEVEWNELYQVADLTPEIIQEEIVNHTENEALTLITCGGTFDPAINEYIERRVIRANLV